MKHRPSVHPLVSLSAAGPPPLSEVLPMKVDITLIENSMTGNPPRSYYGQIVEICREPDTVVPAADGHARMGKQRTEVRWFGHTAAEMAHITDGCLQLGTMADNCTAAPGSRSAPRARLASSLPRPRTCRYRLG
jgi:hypothetical protein